MLKEMRNLTLTDVVGGLVKKLLLVFFPGSFGSGKGLINNGVRLRQKDGFSDVDFFTINGEELFVQIIGDSTTVLDLADHVLESEPFEVKGVGSLG
jgi:hypothetical protein